ncbi:MAG: hypothetical protein SNJ52_01345 [Verrucomicrobiia bacterium]
MLANGAARRLAGLPFKRVALLTLFLFCIKEFYPFSHFPMYSGLGEDADLFYTRAISGEPIPVLTVFGIRTARLKKQFNTELDAITRERDARRSQATIEEQREAGERALRYLVNNQNDGQRYTYPIRAVELVRVVVEVREGVFRRNEETVARLENLETVR